MTIPYEEVFKEFSAEDQQWIKRRAEELKAEELNLSEMRRLRKLTQTGCRRSSRSGRKEFRGSKAHGSLPFHAAHYVEGLAQTFAGGGIPDRAPVVLTGFGEGSEAQNQETNRKTAQRAGFGQNRRPPCA